MIRLLIRKALQQVGYDIVKYHPAFKTGKLDTENLEKEFEWIREFNFKTILDIGANEGQFAEKIRALFPQASIYSFEPLPDAYKKLISNFANTDKITGINVAIGDAPGEITFHENEYSASSSFLELSGEHMESFDYATKTTPVKVKVDTLDHVMKDIKMESPILVKIDVQGYEDKVIQGGKEILSRTKMVICEVSFTELYRGQTLFDDIYNRFWQLGFIYAGSIEQLRSPKTNAILQADAVFLRQ